MSGPLPSPVRPAFEVGSREGALIVNIGPSHPATHGTVQIIAELDGEGVDEHAILQVIARGQE